MDKRTQAEVDCRAARKCPFWAIFFNIFACDGWNLSHILDHEVEVICQGKQVSKLAGALMILWSHRTTRAGPPVIFHAWEISILFNPLSFVALCHSQPQAILDDTLVLGFNSKALGLDIGFVILCPPLRCHVTKLCIGYRGNLRLKHNKIIFLDKNMALYLKHMKTE